MKKNNYKLKVSNKNKAFVYKERKPKRNHKNKKYKRKETEMKNLDDLTISGFGAVSALFAFFVLIIFIAPWINFWLAYFGGWIAKITVGKYIVEGFSLIGIALPLNKIPLLAGTLGWIGGFFKNVSNLNSKK